MKASKQVLKERLCKTLSENGVTARSRCVLAAVSGGLDSTAMLGLLDALAPELEWQLEVVHFDHGLRTQSAADAKWVQQLTEKLGWVCHVRRTKQLAKLANGVQAAARLWREQEMQELVIQRKAAWAASAHHREDQLETLLMQWLRGVHVAHWRGIAFQRGFWLRPLLDWHRDELKEYLTERGWYWREDCSNQSLIYRRNRLRHQLMENLNQLSGNSLEARLLATRQQAISWHDWLNQLPKLKIGCLGDKQHWLEISSLFEWPLPTQTEGIRRFIQHVKKCGLASCHLQAILALLQKGRLQWQLSLPKGLQLSRAGPKLWLSVSPSKSVSQQVGPWSIFALDHLPLSAHIKANSATPLPHHMILQKLPVPASLVLRYAKPGDRFHPPHCPKPLKLTEWLRQQGVPTWQRARWPVLSCTGLAANNLVANNLVANNLAANNRQAGKNPQPDFTLLAIAPNVAACPHSFAPVSEKKGLEIQLNFPILS